MKMNDEALHWVGKVMTLEEAKATFGVIRDGTRGRPPVDYPEGLGRCGCCNTVLPVEELRESKRFECRECHYVRTKAWQEGPGRESHLKSMRDSYHRHRPRRLARIKARYWTRRADELDGKV